MNPNQAIIRVMPQSVHGGLFGNPMRTETFAAVYASHPDYEQGWAL